MENLLPFFYDRDYVQKRRIKSIKLFLKFFDESSIPSECLACKMEFYKNGFPKIIVALDIDGNYGGQIEYNEKGQKIIEIVNHNYTATFQKPEIDTTIFEYLNGLLIKEKEFNESNYFGVKKKELHYKRSYKYDNQNRLIEEVEKYLPDNSERNKIYEYSDSYIMKEIDLMEDGKINMIIFHKYNEDGNIVEEKAVRTEEEYYDQNYKYQFYRHFHIYDKNSLKKEMQTFDNENKLKSSMKYHYDSNNLLSKIYSFENEQLTSEWRFEYKVK